MIKEFNEVSSVKRVIIMSPPFVTTVREKKEVVYDIKNEVIRDEIRPIVERLAIYR